MQEKRRKKTDPLIQLAVGQRIKELREERQWSQEEFADRCGVHRTYIGSAENGARNLTIQVLEYFDRIGVTQRDGDRRRPARTAP